MNGIIDVYEDYFNNSVSFQFNLQKRNEHKCLICTTDVVEGIYSREFTQKFIIGYLEHLKVFGYSITLCRVFIDSIKQNGILCSKVKGKWLIKKHDIHQVFIVKHLCIDNEKKEEEDEILFLKHIPIHPRDRLKRKFQK